MEGAEGGAAWGDSGEEFSFFYRGSTEVDRHYSKPMLPWIISEIKNRQKKEEVSGCPNISTATDTSCIIVFFSLMFIFGTDPGSLSGDRGY